MLRQVIHCAGLVLANTRPHQLHWGDMEMGTAISCTKWWLAVTWAVALLYLSTICMLLKMFPEATPYQTLDPTLASETAI